jgi:hypothetical protein
MACISAACTGGDAGPMAPSITITPTPTSSPNSFTLTGRVTESAPTQIDGVKGALLTIGDSVNAGRSTSTDAYGFYSISGLQSAGFTLNLSADGYVNTSQAVSVTSNTTMNLQLAPVARQMSHTSTGQLTGTDGTCSDGASQKPCRILVFPVHNAGPIDAALTWNPGEVADLDLTLFQTGTQAPITGSAAAGASPERVSAHVTGGSTYELRVTYRSGRAGTTYTLRVTYPY